jgi:long-subunit fatty acid transport protein
MVALILLCSVASASPTDIYGFGARSMGAGTGGAAFPASSESVALNPALIHGGQQTILGYAFLRSQFEDPPPVAWDTNRDGRIDDDDAFLELAFEHPAADGFFLGGVSRLNRRIWFGWNFFAPLQRMLRIHTFDSSLPMWLLYDNRPYRYSMNGAFSGEVLPGFWIGAGAVVASQAKYKFKASVDAVFDGAEEEEDLSDTFSARLDIHETTLEAAVDLAPRVGLHLDLGEFADALRGLNIGAAYHGTAGTPIEVDAEVQVNFALDDFEDIRDIRFSLYAPFQLSAFDSYIPRRATFGLGLRRWSIFQAHLDAEWTQWSAMTMAVVSVMDGEVDAPILFEESVALEDGNGGYLELRDIWGFRGGLHMEVPNMKGGRELIFRSGYAYQPSIIQRIGSNISPLDAPRQTFTGGLGMTFPSALDGTFDLFGWDAFFQWHSFRPQTLVVDYDTPLTAGYPLGGEIEMRGHLWACGLQTLWEY